MVELNLKTISVIAVSCHLHQRSIAFGSDSYIFICLLINNDRTGCILLIGACIYKTIPVIHYNINRMYRLCIKQTALIPFYCRDFQKSQLPAIHKNQRQKYGSYDGGTADFINVFICRHNYSSTIPYNPRYS